MREASPFSGGVCCGMAAPKGLSEKGLGSGWILRARQPRPGRVRRWSQGA